MLSSTFTHTLFPEDWQLAKAQADEGLTVIVLPLDDGREFGLDWRVGDRICFAEPWVYSNKRKKVQARSWFCLDLDEFVEWQHPRFMPEEAARFWFEVTGIQVEQIKRIPLQVFIDAGFYTMGEDESEYGAKAIARWNDAHVKHPYKPELWAIVLLVKSVEFLEEEE